MTLDIYKGILIILVVLRHVLQYSVSDEGGILTNIIWAVQMPGFMFVSGYFAVKSINNLGDIKKRFLYSVQHYALPFFSWFFLIGVLLLGSYGRNIAVAARVIVKRIDMGMWFLWVVFILSCFATVFNYIWSKARKMKIVKVLVGVGICGIVLLLFACKYGINFMGIKFIMYYSVFYGAGWLTRRIRDQRLIENPAGLVDLAIVIFSVIVFNYDLYHCEDDVIGITLRCIAGFAGIILLWWLADKYSDFFIKLKIDKLGLYTLEIYTTHMWVTGLMEKGNTSEFLTPIGFINFAISLFLTVVFTLILVGVLKGVPLTNFLLYGKRKE